jgi:hypothetical protein
MNADYISLDIFPNYHYHVKINSTKLMATKNILLQLSPRNQKFVPTPMYVITAWLIVMRSYLCIGMYNGVSLNTVVCQSFSCMMYYNYSLLITVKFRLILVDFLTEW